MDLPPFFISELLPSILRVSSFLWRKIFRTQTVLKIYLFCYLTKMDQKCEHMKTHATSPGSDQWVPACLENSSKSKRGGHCIAFGHPALPLGNLSYFLRLLLVKPGPQLHCSYSQGQCCCLKYATSLAKNFLKNTPIPICKKCNLHLCNILDKAITPPFQTINGCRGSFVCFWPLTATTVPWLYCTRIAYIDALLFAPLLVFSHPPSQSVFLFILFHPNFLVQSVSLKIILLFLKCAFSLGHM